MSDLGKLVHKSGYVDMRSQAHEQNVMADAFNKVCAENQRMRELLGKASAFLYAYLPVGDRHIQIEIESFLSEHP
jgi:hypothetical protein